MSSTVGFDRVAHHARRAGPRELRERFGRRAVREIEALRDAGRLYLFAPLCFALGILLYFTLPHEPWPALLLAASACVGWFGRHRIAARAGALFLAGLAVPALHAAILGDLPRSLPDGPRRLVGVVERTEGRGEDGSRLLIRLEDGLRGAERLLLSARDPTQVAPGTRVNVVALPTYAPGPVLPGRYDHARRLYFEGVDGIGIVIAGPFPTGERSERLTDRARGAIASVRLAIEARITDVLDGQSAALASALLTGRRDALTEDTLEMMRGSGLAHVLAISGMHMGLFCTSLFVALRAVLALIGLSGVRLPVKKLAALGALAGATFYLVISGMQIATQRAYVMAAIVCVAVLLDRPALTLRNVATAALIVLALSPESLMGASFQMSFAATIALIAVYERWNMRTRGSETVLSIPGQQLGALFVTSLTAGLATSPYAAFHFSRLATYGLLANLAAMPFVTALVMPAGLASLLAMPFGLEALPLTVMGWGIDGLRTVAEGISEWPNAMRPVPNPEPTGLVLASVGLYTVAIAPGAMFRFAGACALAGAVVVHLSQPVPFVMVGENGKTFAVADSDSQWTTLGGRFSRFTEERWAEAAAFSADAKPSDGADDTSANHCDATQCVFRAADTTIVSAWRPETVQDACLTATILISPLPRPTSCPSPTLVLEASAFEAGSIMIERDDSRFLARPVTPRDRPWRRPPPSP